MDKVSNKDLWERTNLVQIEIDILKSRWGWLDHTLRNPNSNITRQALTGRSKRWTFSETADNRGQSRTIADNRRTIVTLPSVLSAVCIAQNGYLADSLLIV